MTNPRRTPALLDLPRVELASQTEAGCADQNDIIRLVQIWQTRLANAETPD